MKILLTTCICFMALSAADFAQQDQKQEFSIKVGVEEVRIDTMVLDRKGLQVTDLTVDDFEIYQDGRRQKIESCVYVDDSRKSGKTTVSAEAAKAQALLTKPKPTKGEVRRTFAFLADSGYETRIALKKFVETQMEPGDLVAILSGAPQLGGQSFIPDKQQLLARIANIPGHQASRGTGVSIVDASRSYEDVQRIQNPTFRSFVAEGYGATDEAYIAYLKGLIAPIRYAIRALKDMPGRKYLVLMRSDIFYKAGSLPIIQERLFNEAANEAWRAGVVIFTLDMNGLNNEQQDSFGKRYLPFSQKTGGILVENSNFFFNGIKPVQESTRGYYLLSYIPPAGTFESDPQKMYKYHRVRIRVKRAGTEVHSRDGFLASSGASDFAAVPQTNTLQQAIFSPIRYDDLKLSLSSGYAHAPASGYFLRSWMHLDGKDLAFKEEGEDERSLSLKLETLTSDSNGRIQDVKAFQYDFRLDDADILRIRKDGIDLKTYLPVKSPGYYYVSAAIQDRASGKIGSGYQYLDIPDLGRPQMSLSSILALTSEKEASIINSGNIQNDPDSYNALRKWQAIARSPALRKYKPGEGFDYMTTVHNAKTGQQPPQLELQSVLFKDGQIYRRDPPEDINIEKIDELGRIPILRRLIFDGSMGEGDYLLQLTVSDKPLSGKPPKGWKQHTATQVIDFQIAKE
jgi:VWFA-related protein